MTYRRGIERERTVNGRTLCGGKQETGIRTGWGRENMTGYGVEDLSDMMGSWGELFYETE